MDSASAISRWSAKTRGADDDALIVNRLDALPLAFEMDDFNNVTVGGEWLVSVNSYLELGAGARLLLAYGAERV